mmetsp:Transcript_52371/g.83623  ORF Transcript_52371/g.83623 Transcript_52371/m.83623 type:complete len:285 (+) Transcript_52371:358-1212(+)
MLVGLYKCLPNPAVEALDLCFKKREICLQISFLFPRHGGIMKILPVAEDCREQFFLFLRVIPFPAVQRLIPGLPALPAQLVDAQRLLQQLLRLRRRGGARAIVQALQGQAVAGHLADQVETERHEDLLRLILALFKAHLIVQNYVGRHSSSPTNFRGDFVPLLLLFISSLHLTIISGIVMAIPMSDQVHVFIHKVENEVTQRLGAPLRLFTFDEVPKFLFLQSGGLNQQWQELLNLQVVTVLPAAGEDVPPSRRHKPLLLAFALQIIQSFLDLAFQFSFGIFRK